ncbi:MAG: RimK family protein [Myxococcales bacterium]|jgi:glutathione synthase/RimK-type ligase-like ATP-grasp enzyme|nr:RimK family protein [Myxococcales bacterium]
MGQVLIVIEDFRDWKPYYPSEKVITAQQYLLDHDYFGATGTQVINLCRNYRYLSMGWYVSLLAESRRHRVLPGTRAMHDLSRRSIYSLDLEEFDVQVRKALAPNAKKCSPSWLPDGDTISLRVFFGNCEYPELSNMAKQLFEIFNVPLLQVELRKKGTWRIERVFPCDLRALGETEEDRFAETLERFNRKVWPASKRPRKHNRYDLAILHSADEKLPPSNARALRKFLRIARSLDISAELIEKKDYSHLAEYDALFIRETTAINHHTYRFAKKAESEGMVVIDDPRSILRCTNKIYMASLLGSHRVPHPRTLVLTRDSFRHATDPIADLGFPLILKIPDGAFSRGMTKAHNRDELEAAIQRFFKQSDLVLVQEFLFTEYDWRIGILNGRPLYACQYFMSRGHWQIVEHQHDGRVRVGDARTWPIIEAPRPVVQLAVKAANLIGDGLYGVDIKETAHGPVVMEVNDNPSIDAGVEDEFLGDHLYIAILEEFIRRLDSRHRPI